MAVVQLSDVVVPEFYANYGKFDSMTSTALFQSGILQQNPILDAHVTGPGQIANVPMWGDLAAANDAGGTEPNIGTDNPADVAATKKISAVNMLVRKSLLNDSWSAANLAVPVKRVSWLVLVELQDMANLKLFSNVQCLEYAP